ncbi:hypothetical protein BD560DRAFT_488473 [Blakeslea trispora]|nr:hypothetical protein BD560DRAFT_488473 [Blakeslea trispora]
MSSNNDNFANRATSCCGVEVTLGSSSKSWSLLVHHIYNVVAEEAKEDKEEERPLLYKLRSERHSATRLRLDFYCFVQNKFKPKVVKAVEEVERVEEVEKEITSNHRKIQYFDERILNLLEIHWFANNNDHSAVITAFRRKSITAAKEGLAILNELDLTDERGEVVKMLELNYNFIFL